MADSTIISGTTGIGTNGFSDNLEGSPEDGIANYTITETSSGTYDFQNNAIFSECSVSAPIATDDGESTEVGVAVVINVLSNDTDVDGDINNASVSTTGVNQPSNGTITNINTSTGAITYTPNGGYEGTDNFEYIVCDQTSPTPLCDTATVIVTIENCTATGSQKIITGTVFSDSNNNGLLESESGLQSIDVKLSLIHI